jgi:lipopolysaccharide transport system ATP-binding protein
MSSEPAIAAAGLSKAYRIYARPQDRLLQVLYRRRKRLYRDFWALEGVSFEVERGTTLGVIGRNGSGKSTLLQLVAGTLHPTRGQVTTRGRVSALLELGTGFNYEFTGRENVLLNAAVFGLTPGEIEAKFGDIVAFADIGEFLGRPVKTYSSGMVVRLAFAVAISVDPDILIVDEALAVGDMGFQRKCYRRINEMREKGVTCLFVTHDTGTIRSLCDKAMLLERGRVLEMGDTKHVADCYVRLLLGEEADGDAPESVTTAPQAPLHAGEEPGVLAEPGFSAVPKELRFDISEGHDPPVQGNLRAYVARSVLLDESGEVAHNTYVGQHFRVRSLIRFHDAVDHFLYGVLVRNRFGQDLFGDSAQSANLGIGQDFGPQDAVVVDTVIRGDLRQDTYFISLGIESFSRGERFFYAMDTMQLRLEPVGTGVFGLAQLPHRFEAKRLRYADAPSSAPGR